MRSVLAAVTILFLQQTAPPAERDVQESIAVDGGTRTYRVFIPETAGRSGPPPAVVLYLSLIHI